MRTLAINILLFLSLYCFGQENSTHEYLCRFNTSATHLNYKLLLADNNTFFLYGYGSQLDMIYPNEVYYGNYSESNDSLSFSFISPDSIIVETNKGWENKLLFCGDTIYVWDEIYKKDSFKYSSCIINEDRIEFKDTDLRGHIFFLVDTLQKKYNLSIKGNLPKSFNNYVKSVEFSLKQINEDIRIAHFPDINSSIDIWQDNRNYNQGGDLDSFSLTFANYIAKSNLFIYSHQLYDRFIPITISVDSLLTDSINKVVLRLTDKHCIKWKYLNESHYLQIPKIKSECLVNNEYGQVINISKEKQKLRSKILRKNISYFDAYRNLLKSRYFDNKKYGIILSDSLTSNSDFIFNLSYTFSMNSLEKIYQSFYSIPESIFNSKKIKRQLCQNESKMEFFISKAGFNENRTICFLPIQLSEKDSRKREVLVFERRINEFVLTGKVIDGEYYDILEGEECEYYPDMRNYRLFY